MRSSVSARNCLSHVPRMQKGVICVQTARHERQECADFTLEDRGGTERADSWPSAGQSYGGLRGVRERGVQENAPDIWAVAVQEMPSGSTEAPVGIRAEGRVRGAPPDAAPEVLAPDGAEFDRLLRSRLAASPRAVPPPEEREGRADRCPCIGKADPLSREKLLDEPFTAPPA